MANLDEMQWRATEWVLAFGPLHGENALDYFELSPFFDQSSNNAVLRMQNQYAAEGMNGVDQVLELSKFTGLEYCVIHAAPPNFFIIQSQNRSSPSVVTPLNSFYILDDSIYKANSLYNIVNQRLLTALNALSTSFELLTKHKPAYSQAATQNWLIKPSLTQAPVAVATTELFFDSSIKRPRDESDENQTDDTTLIPTNAFNPLLFGAITTLAPTLIPPPVVAPLPPPPEPEPPKPKEPSVEAVEEKAKASTGSNTVDVKGNTIRLSASGRRKPKAAA